MIRNSTPLIKSILLCGPKGSGKSTLISALCYDLGATLFDLTATNIVGRYPGKAGLNMLTHLVLKVIFYGALKDAIIAKIQLTIALNILYLFYDLTSCTHRRICLHLYLKAALIIIL